MATKKQKRQAALEKRQNFEAELRRTGLEAQRRSREERTRETLKEQEELHKKHNRFEDWCLHCQIIKKAVARGEKAKDAYRYIDEAMARRTDEPVRTITNARVISASLSPNGLGTIELADAASLEMECI